MIILDVNPIRRLVGRDREMLALVKGRAERGETVGVSAATLVEAIHHAMDVSAAPSALAGVKVVEVSRDVATTAIAMRRESGRLGHPPDAILCATAVLADERPVTIVTSDPAALRVLLAGHPEVSVLRVR
jgi:predicted nucleic acid-binding protein